MPSVLSVWRDGAALLVIDGPHSVKMAVVEQTRNTQPFPRLVAGIGPLGALAPCRPSPRRQADLGPLKYLQQAMHVQEPVAGDGEQLRLLVEGRLGHFVDAGVAVAREGGCGRQANTPLGTETHPGGLVLAGELGLDCSPREVLALLWAAGAGKGYPRHVVQVKVFDNDDTSYERWLTANPDGFVVNCGRPATASYIVLHRASCGTITGTPARGGTWTVAYRKVCAQSRAELNAWAQHEAGARPSPCGLCRP